MKNTIIKYLKEYNYDPFKIDRLIISSYVYSNNIKFKRNRLLNKYLIRTTDTTEYTHLVNFLAVYSKTEADRLMSFEDIIELFEFVISPADKKVNGAVYTPKYIRDYILTQSLSIIDLATQDLENIKIADISCGCGGFLLDAVLCLRKLTNKSFIDIFSRNIYGLDIQEYSIKRTILILTLLAVTEGEDIREFSFNLFVGNALNFDWSKIEMYNHQGFDVIVGNPPYVGSTKIDYESRLLLDNWAVAQSGKADLYIPFFEIGISNLKRNGVLGYITVNTFFKSLNGRALREYFAVNSFKLTIIDFQGEQVFKGRSTYTCICFVQNISSKNISFTTSSSLEIERLIHKDFLQIPYQSLNNFHGWLLSDKTTSEKILAIQQTGIPLGELFEIRNGFATLQNDVYVFRVHKEFKNHYSFIKNGIEFKVEKGICKDAIKPNIIKTETDIVQIMEKIIFPYEIVLNYDIFDNPTRQVILMEENNFKKRFPYAYSYLDANRISLKNRDKGNKVYQSWFAFGRNQALNLVGSKLLFPYISNAPYFVFTDDKELLFYNGYAIFSTDERDLQVLKKILSSNLFWYYIKEFSKPYDNGYYSLAKNYIKHFGIYNFSESQKEKLLNISQKEANILIEEMYGIQV